MKQKHTKKKQRKEMEANTMCIAGDVLAANVVANARRAAAVVVTDGSGALSVSGPVTAAAAAAAASAGEDMTGVDFSDFFPEVMAVGVDDVAPTTTAAVAIVEVVGMVSTANGCGRNPPALPGTVDVDNGVKNVRGAVVSGGALVAWPKARAFGAWTSMALGGSWDLGVSPAALMASAAFWQGRVGKRRTYSNNRKYQYQRKHTL